MLVFPLLISLFSYCSFSNTPPFILGMKLQTPLLLRAFHLKSLSAQEVRGNEICDMSEVGN
jgi:hypothetical protein